MSNYQFFIDLFIFLQTLGESCVETANGVLDFLQMPIEGFPDAQLWQLFLGLFITIIVPYTVIKWLIPV